jgi:hypothetical protein
MQGEQKTMGTDSALIANVREILESCARDGRMIAFSDVERRPGTSVSSWKIILDSISEDCRSIGQADLTSILIYAATSYPPFFNGGDDGRSQPFNPNNLKQVALWREEVARVFDDWKKEAPVVDSSISALLVSWFSRRSEDHDTRG